MNALTGRRVAWIRVVAIVPLLAAGIALGGPAPASAATFCSGSNDGAITGTVRESVVVPAGAECLLLGASVRGGVTVEPGGYLYTSDTEIRGSVSGSGVLNVQISGGVIRGDVTVVGSRTAGVFMAEVRGSVTLTGVASNALLAFSTVRGSATLNDNDSAQVTDNTIQLNLACANNTNGADNLGAPNRVGGTRSGQCANL